MSIDKTAAEATLKEASYLLHNFDELIDSNELTKEAEEIITESGAYIDLEELTKLAEGTNG